MPPSKILTPILNFGGYYSLKYGIIKIFFVKNLKISSSCTLFGVLEHIIKNVYLNLWLILKLENKKRVKFK